MKRYKKKKKNWVPFFIEYYDSGTTKTSPFSQNRFHTHNNMAFAQQQNLKT